MNVYFSSAIRAFRHFFAGLFVVPDKKTACSIIQFLNVTFKNTFFSRKRTHLFVPSGFFNLEKGAQAMKKLLYVPAVLVLLAAGVFAPAVLRGQSSSPASAQDPSKPDPDNAPIVKLQLFKNGFGFVTREIAPRDWKDPLVLQPAISPRHGTLWFEPAETIIRRTTRERTMVAQPDKKNETPGYRADWSSMTDVYEWKQVTLKMKDGSSISGTVVGNRKPQQDNGNQPQTIEVIDTLSAYRSTSSSVRTYPAGTSIAAKSPFGLQFLTVQTDDGYVSVRQDDVVEIRAKSLSDGESGAPSAERKTKTTEEVQVVEAPKNHLGPVRMRYLSQDITWSPFYRVNLNDAGKLTINASATVMNNLENFEDAEVEFISGFPNMVFASSPSALSKGMSFQSFLNNLANPSEPSYLRSTSSRSSVMRQAEMLSNSSVYYDMDDVEGYQAQKPTLWTASGMDDMQYKSAGKLSMRKGDVLQLPIASADADFEHIVSWTAPMEKRFSFGEASADATLWNCIRFRNPFDFALTSAPYEIEQDGNVLGQSTGTWYGAGQLATVRITKSMAVTATMTQVESGSLNRYYTETKWNNNYRFHYPDVTAQIVLTNHGTKPVKVVFDSVFYGELINANGTPKETKLLTDNRTRNQKNKLTWEVSVPASDKATINYTYKIILDN